MYAPDSGVSRNHDPRRGWPIHHRDLQPGAPALAEAANPEKKLGDGRARSGAPARRTRGKFNADNSDKCVHSCWRAHPPPRHPDCACAWDSMEKAGPAEAREKETVPVSSHIAGPGQGDPSSSGPYALPPAGGTEEVLRLYVRTTGRKVRRATSPSGTVGAVVAGTPEEKEHGGHGGPAPRAAPLEVGRGGPPPPSAGQCGRCPTGKLEYKQLAAKRDNYNRDGGAGGHICFTGDALGARYVPGKGALRPAAL